MTAAAAAVNVALVAPCATVTDAGTDSAAGALLASDTLVPLLPAAFETVTVQVVVPEAGTDELPHCREVIVAGAITMTAVEAFHCPIDAVSITFWSVVTAAAVAVKLPLVVPDGTVTEEGTDKAADALLLKATVAPLLPAGLESVIPHAMEPDAGRLPVPHCNPEICIAVASEKLTVFVAPPRLALTVAC